MKLYLTAIFIVICSNILVSLGNIPKPKKDHTTKHHTAKHHTTKHYTTKKPTTDSTDDKVALRANEVYPQYDYPQFVFLSLKDLKTINEQIAKFQRWEECFLSPGSMKGCTGDPDSIAKRIVDKIIETRKKIPQQQIDMMNLIKRKQKKKNKDKLNDNGRTNDNIIPEERTINAKDIYPKFDLSDSLKLSLSNIREINDALISFNRNESCYLSPGGAMSGCKGDYTEVSKKIIEKIASSDALRKS